MATDAVYHAMVAALFAHELDAVKRHEWRVLPLFRAMPERAGEQLFIWVHVPLFLAILHFGGPGASGDGFRLGLSAFAVLHVGLHWLFRKHPAYEFDNPSSWGLILLAGAFGAAYLFASWA